MDEGPSPEDLERFGDETGHCPTCGAEIWDQAEYCPKCDEHVGGGTLSRPPDETWLRRRWLGVVALVALFAFVLVIIGPRGCSS